MHTPSVLRMLMLFLLLRQVKEQNARKTVQSLQRVSIFARLGVSTTPSRVQAYGLQYCNGSTRLMNPSSPSLWSYSVPQDNLWTLGQNTSTFFGGGGRASSSPSISQESQLRSTKARCAATWDALDGKIVEAVPGGGYSRYSPGLRNAFVRELGTIILYAPHVLLRRI